MRKLLAAGALLLVLGANVALAGMAGHAATQGMSLDQAFGVVQQLFEKDNAAARGAG